MASLPIFIHLSSTDLADIRPDSDLRQRADKAFHEQFREPCLSFRVATQKHQVDGELEIDETALVALSGNRGAYVQAWLWVYREETYE